MNVRNMARWCALGAITALLAAAAPAVSAVSASTGLPACPAGHASTRAPSTPAGPHSPGACRAVGRILESGIQVARQEQTDFTPSGYHHLGANSAGEWSGVSGRISVVDGSIRPGSYDFVAARFMVKRDMGGGNIAWLEAGWAQTGWAGPLRQHIYTFNTNTHTWQFYDQYALRPGDRVWMDLHSDANGMWGAWLWWNNRWNLLTAQRLPIGQSAYVEQYVEVHVDAGRPARIDVPSVTVDNVQLRPPDGTAARYWRDDVPTLTGYGPGQPQRTGGFCLNWVNRYDTWTAGDCMPDTSGQGATAPSPDLTDLSNLSGRNPNPATTTSATQPAAQGLTAQQPAAAGTGMMGMGTGAGTTGTGTGAGATGTTGTGTTGTGTTGTGATGTGEEDTGATGTDAKSPGAPGGDTREPGSQGGAGTQGQSLLSGLLG